MPEPISLTTALLVAGGLKAAGGIASGIGEARAGKKMMLTDAQKKELEELERRQARGQLGLHKRERGTLEQRFLTEQAGAQRELEASALQQAAARGLGGAVSGREVFLQEQAESGARLEMRQRQNEAVLEADRAERDAERARIDAMNAQQQAAEARRAQGIMQAASLGLAGAGDVATEATMLALRAELMGLEGAPPDPQDGIDGLDTPGERNFGVGGN